MSNINKPISILHIALEGGPVVFGGLGRVATQMVASQNCFRINDAQQLKASIITPYYPKLQASQHKIEIGHIKHLYNDHIVISKIFMIEHENYQQYIVEPDSRYPNMFNICSLPEIYLDTEDTFFIERVKYFNSCVAAFVANSGIGQLPNIDILHLHDWQAALVPKLLKLYYRNDNIKSVFTVHIDSGDRGTFPSSCLDGIGLSFSSDKTILKAVGALASDKIVGVSPKFMQECIEAISNDEEAEFVRKVFAIQYAQNKTVGISNGIIYKDYNPIGKLIFDESNIYSEKVKIKQQLANELCGPRLVWEFDPTLPMILYVGRYSPEKGTEVFDQIIQEVSGLATFVAIGRGMTDDVFKALITHSRQTDNVFISASEKEQALLLAKIRAAADIVMVPSHRDAFGLVAPEGLANGSIIVTTGVGGLKDIIKGLDITNKDQTIGNGIFYEDNPYGGHNPDLSVALKKILQIWKTMTPSQINSMQKRVMNEAKIFDWQAPDGSLRKYLDVYQELLAEPKANTISVVP